MTELEKLAVEYVQAVEKELKLQTEYIHHTMTSGFNHREAQEKSQAYHEAGKAAKMAYESMALYIKEKVAMQPFYVLALTQEERDTFIAFLEGTEPHSDKEHALFDYFYSQLVEGYERDEDEDEAEEGDPE